jgi:hypothetical protein
MKHARSDGRRPGSSGAVSGVPATIVSQSWTAGPTGISSGRPETTTWARSGVPEATVETREVRSPWTRTTLAALSARTWRRNSPLSAVFIGTWIAPSLRAAKNETTCSGEFSKRVATRSPVPTPSPASAWARWFAATSISRAVKARPSTSR